MVFLSEGSKNDVARKDERQNDDSKEKEEEYEQWRISMKERLQELKGEGYRIIYLDECGFTTKTLQMNDYTNKNYKHRI